MNGTEEFWAGEFGDEYTQRNPGNPTADQHFFRTALRHFDRSVIGQRRLPTEIQSVLELGANVGNNLLALRRLVPQARLAGVEINPTAFKRLQTNADMSWGESFLNGGFGGFDLVLTKGVLIHVDPEDLPRAYDVIFECSNHYILVAEYYAKTPTPVTYRGHEGKLWRRDFAGELLDRFSELRWLDYGFVWDRDPFPQDSITWFLLEKMGAT